MICGSCQAENDDSADTCVHCGSWLGTDVTPEVVVVDFSPGVLLQGRYEMRGLVGRGGMGMVYRAHDRVLDETVALKVLRPDLATDPRMRERFKSEIKLARRVRHRNVCAIHDYGEESGLLFISMEFVEGTDLKRFIHERGGLPPELAYDLVLQVAEGLAAVHEAGIVHRDLKSSNIMRDVSGAARLMDFGIARPAGHATPTRIDQVVGTPEYMSPEQARGQKADARSDLYALGIVTYEMFTGRLPFRGETPVSTILKQIQEAPPLKGAAASRVPTALAPVIARALAKSPEARYQTARAFAEDVRRAQSGQATATERRWNLSAALWLATAALAVGGVALVARGTVTPPPPPAPPVGTSPDAPPPSAPSPSPPPSPTRSPSRGQPDAARTPTPAPTERASPAPVAMPTTVAQEGAGALQVVVRPWADVSIDGTPHGETPFDRIPLPSGPHVVQLRHPRYGLVEKRITIEPGRTEKIVVDMPVEGEPP